MRWTASSSTISTAGGRWARDAGFAANGGTVESSLRFEGTYLPSSGCAAARWLVERHGGAMPSAIFFGNFPMASGALSEFYDQGLRVPQDLALAVFDDLPQLEYIRPRITRVGNSPTVLAERATSMLLDRLNKKLAGPARTEVVPCIMGAFDTA